MLLCLGSLQMGVDISTCQMICKSTDRDDGDKRCRVELIGWQIKGYLGTQETAMLTLLATCIR